MKNKSETEADSEYDFGGSQTDELGETGESNTYQDQRDKETGELERRRYYGEDGRVVKDTDFKHSGGKDHTFPHDHYWDWSDPKNPNRYHPILWD